MRHIYSPIIILFLLLVIFISTRVPDFEINLTKKNSADFQFVNVTISMHKEGKKLWTLNAKESSIYNQSQTFFLLDIDGTLIGNGLHTLTFKSPTGAYQMKNQSLKLVKTNEKLNLVNKTYFIICDEIEINSKKIWYPPTATC